MIVDTLFLLCIAVVKPGRRLGITGETVLNWIANK
jgi:hypothetical protein